MNAKNDFGLLWMSATGHYTAGGTNGGGKDEDALLPWRNLQNPCNGNFPLISNNVSSFCHSFTLSVLSGV
jgi:hypothetical protein